MLALRWSPEHSAAAYPDPFALFADAVDLLRSEVDELAALGCEYIQIDAPELATLVDPSTRERVYAAHGVSPERMLGEGLEMLDAVADAPELTFGLHLCRGNNAGHWMSAGGYEAISREVFARAPRYHIFLLEYDTPRAGSFESLRDVPDDKRVVLGLVSTKTDALEPPEALIARIDEAARHFPREQMALSTQCGFASVMAGNPIAEATQERKLRLVAEVARRVWD
jgi:5-methyltetrahydropteroyltriglutamate--homocysteine methyltransferase